MTVALCILEPNLCCTVKKFIVCFNFTLKDQNIKVGIMICVTFFHYSKEIYYKWQGPYENSEKTRIIFMEMNHLVLTKNYLPTKLLLVPCYNWFVGQKS